MAPGFELMGWLKQAGAQAVPQTDVAVQPPSAPAGQVANTASVAAVSGRITAPHSQAAAALAAALSSGGVPEKKHPQPHGAPIPPLQELVEVDRIRPESASALVVSKIANYPSESCRRHGHSVAVDANYICYGLKGGQIRILNRHTGARTLLKDHAAPVTDLRFFRYDSERCLLASVDTTGQVHVRKVYEDDADGKDAVGDEILARHELPIPVSGPTAHPPARLAWHPTYDFVLAVAAGPTVYLINVPPTADVAAAPEYLAPVAAARSTDGAVMTSVAFSPLGDLLAAGDAHGFVYIWALSSEQLDPALIQPLPAEPDIRFQAYGSAPGEAPYGDGTGDSAAVASLSWLPRGGSGGGDPESGGDGGGGESGGGAAALVLLTGDGVNAHLRLWAIDLCSKPQCTHAIRLTSAAATGAVAPGAFFNHLEAHPMYDCVVLANELRNHVYVLHVDLALLPGAPTFDYVSEFSVKMPILSCTLEPQAFEDEATGAEAFHMYTIQSDSVQQYTLVPAQCFPMQPRPSAAALGGAAAAGVHYPHFPHASGIVGGSAASGTIDAAGRLSKDPLAVLLALQQQQHEERGMPAPSAFSASTAATTMAAAPQQQQPSLSMIALREMPSDMSDATSPLLGADGATVDASISIEVIGTAGDGVDASKATSPVSEQVQEGEAALRMAAEADATSAEALDAAVAAVAAGTVAAEAQDEDMLAQAEALPPRSTVRPTLLLTPSQLMQSAAAAAAAARSAASSSASTPAPVVSLAPQDEPYGAAAVAADGGDIDTTASTAGSTRSLSIATISNTITPSLSDGNLANPDALVAAAVAEAAEDETQAAATRADLKEADTAVALAASNALPLSTAILAAAALAQQSPASLPPRPSEELVRRISLGKSSPVQPPPHPGFRGQRSSSSSLPPASPSAASPPPNTVANGEEEHLFAAATAAAQAATLLPLPLPLASMSQSHAAAAALPSSVEPQVQQQQALAQLLALQQQLLEQVSSGQRELLKVVRAEAQRNSKTAADAAATRAAEAVARRAAEERRKETSELQKAVTGAINHAVQDLSQRVADAAAATTAAVKAAIGPAVRAAVAEALPAALSAGGTAAALERALGSQMAASLPRAVADGLGAAFTAQVVPPLERATSTMFGQIEAALRTGLDTHLAPLGPLGSLGGQLRDAASQVQAAAKSMKSEAAAAAQQAAAAAVKAAAAAASPPVLPPAAAAPTASAPSAGSAAKGAAKAPAAPPPPLPAVAAASGAAGPARSAASDAPAAVTAAASAAAVAVAGPGTASAAVRAQPAATHAAAATSSTTRAEAAAAAVAAAPAVVPQPKPAVAAALAPAPPPPTVDAATRNLVLGLIRAGDLDGALSRVLERQDLSLVLWACGEAGGAAILAVEPCPLGQATLLSLLTFLSYDLTSDVDLKLSWIDAILKRLDVREPDLAPHIRGVLDNVKAALAVIARGGSGATAGKAKQAVHQAIGLIAMLS